MYDEIEDVRFWDYQAGDGYRDPDAIPTWRYLCIPDTKCAEVLSFPLSTPIYIGSGSSRLNLAKREVWEVSDEWTYGEGHPDRLDMPGTQAGDLDSSLWTAYDALAQFEEFDDVDVPTLPLFSCSRSQYTRGYLGETCDINAQCSAALGLSCMYASSDADDAKVKTCQDTARCGDEITGVDATWVCDGANGYLTGLSVLLLVATVFSI